MVTKIFKWVFETILRKKLGLKKGPPSPAIKWHESENVWMGILVALHGTYQVARIVAPMFGKELPGIPETYLATISSILGGGIVWSRVTAERLVK